MADVTVSRRSRSFTVQVGTSTATSTTFPMDEFSAAVVQVDGPPSSAVTTLETFVAADGVNFHRAVGGAVTLARVEDGTSLAGVAGLYAFPLLGSVRRLTPAAAWRFVRLVADAELGPGVTVTVSCRT
jgi:hypothetical protein